jgi:hypothetical protein
MGPVIRVLRRVTGPLFRQAEVDSHCAISASRPAGPAREIR